MNVALTEAVELAAIEVSINTSSEFSADDWENLVGLDWVTSFSDDQNVITFGAAPPAGEVQDVIALYLATDGPGESLISALTVLDEDDYEQTLNITLGSLDSDGDGLSDAEEAELGTNPDAADTDGDGLSDSVEVALGTNPLLADTDGDGYSDSEEQQEGTSPNDANDQPVSGLSILIFKAAIDGPKVRSIG